MGVIVVGHIVEAPLGIVRTEIADHLLPHGGGRIEIGSQAFQGVLALLPQLGIRLLDGEGELGYEGVVAPGLALGILIVEGCTLLGQCPEDADKADQRTEKNAEGIAKLFTHKRQRFSRSKRLALRRRGKGEITKGARAPETKN